MHNPILYYQSGSVKFKPSDIIPKLWIDGSDHSKITSTVDSLGRVVDAVTSKDSTAFVSASLASGALANKPRFNGEGLYCNGSYGFTLGTTSDFNYLHNSGGFTVYFVFKQLSGLADQTNPYPIFRTATSSTQVGVSISYYNRSATTNLRTFQIFISNGAGGTAQFLINGAQNAIADDDYNVLKIKFSGTSLQAWVKKRGGSFTSIGTDSTGSTSAANAANVMNFCSNGTSWKGYMKHFITWDRVINSTEEVLMDSWATAEMEKGITETPINVYVNGPAQSNFWGRGDNASIHSDLNGKVGALVWYPNVNSNAISKGLPYWTELEKGVSSNPDNGETTHGFMNRFGYQMKMISGFETAILAYAESGIRLKTTASTIDWGCTSVEAGDLYPKWKNTIMPNGFNDLKHVLRRTPILRGMICMQGEQDAVSDGSTYRADLEAWIKAATDDLITMGVNTTKMRVFIYRIANSYPGFNATHLASVRQAQVDVANQTGGTDFSAYIPSKFKGITWSDTDSKGLNADNLHYSASGHDSMGYDIWNYFKLYANE